MDLVNLQDRKFLWLLFSALTVSLFEFFALAGLRLPSSLEQPFFFVFILITGHQTLWHGWKALMGFHFDSIQALMCIAVAGAWYLEKYEEAAVVIVLYTLAEKLEEMGLERSRASLESLLKEMPPSAFLPSRNARVPLEEVAIGEIIGIKPFERIPLDAKVLSGLSFVDESLITGEPLPQEKTGGDNLYAGTWNKQGYLEAEVLKSSQDTVLAKIQSTTLEALRLKAPSLQFIERFSRYYTPTILLLAALWIFIPVIFFGQSLAPWLAEGLAMIVIACPCALVISAPVAIYSAMSNASSQGIWIKGGQYLEGIGKIRAMALDKTGTLTYGRPVVSDVIPYGGLSKAQLLECAAGIELFSEHPLAQSIVEAAKKEGLTVHPVENFRSFAGKGAQADCLICTDAHHCLGKLPFILEEHAVPEEVILRVEELQQSGTTPIVIATREGVEGIISLTDEVRSESRGLIDELGELNITPILLTGDHWPAARSLALQLGIGVVQAELLPEEKAQAIEKLMKQYGSVAMVGDGINDAPALALSSVGISTGAIERHAAVEAAAIVILNGRLDRLPSLVRLGRKTTRLIQLNTMLALGVKLLFVAFALTGTSNLALAIFADTGVTFMVILNSLRLRNSFPRWP